jgi:hypothetical protein
VAASMDAAALEALLARKRAAQGIVLKELPATPPEDPPPPANRGAVERMLASTTNAKATARLQRQLERSVEDRAPSMMAPAGPDLSLVDLVHRGHDGYVPLATKSRGPWQELGCVPANVLGGLFGDQLLEELETDSYFGLHGMFRPGYYRHRSTLPGLAPSLRKARHVRWLTTCHVDLDTYTVGMDAEAGVAAVLRAAREGVVPPPSMFSIARGCWAWWLLRADDGRGPVRAWPATVDRWSTIQGTLHRRLSRLGSDAAQLHAAACSRVPGSCHTNAKRRVAWMACFDDQGKPFVYTLPELANALGVELKPETVLEHRPTDDRPKDPTRIERGRRGYHSRWERYMAVLDQLRRMRGGWRVGTRAKALHLVAHGCRARGWDTVRCMEELTRHLDGMEQPAGDQLKPAQLRRILKSTGKPKAGGVQWQTVADQLDVTTDESAVLSTPRSTIPPARRHQLLPDVKPVPPDERQRRRREAISAILKRREQEMGHFDRKWWVPTTRDLRDMLVADGHAPASDRTLLKDLVAIGCPSPRTHKPRETKDNQLQLPAPDAWPPPAKRRRGL